MVDRVGGEPNAFRLGERLGLRCRVLAARDDVSDGPDRSARRTGSSRTTSKSSGRPPALLHGGFGLRTVGNLRKPRWWALELLERLGSRRVDVTVSGDGGGSLVEAVAARRRRRHSGRSALERHARPEQGRRRPSAGSSCHGAGDGAGPGCGVPPTALSGRRRSFEYQQGVGPDRSTERPGPTMISGPSSSGPTGSRNSRRPRCSSRLGEAMVAFDLPDAGHLVFGALIPGTALALRGTELTIHAPAGWRPPRCWARKRSAAA